MKYNRGTKKKEDSSMSKKLSVGDFLYDTDDNKYAVIFSSEDDVVLCLCNGSRSQLTLETFSAESVFSRMEKGEFRTISSQMPSIDESSMTEKQMSAYRRNLDIVSRIEDEYGPSFLGLQGKGRKPLIRELCEEYGLSGTGIWNIIKAYLQSGCSKESLVSRRGGSLPDRRYKNVPGRPAEFDDGTAKLLTAEDKENFAEALELYRCGGNGVRTKMDAYIAMLRSHYTDVSIGEDGSRKYTLLPEGQFPNIRQFYHYVSCNLPKEDAKRTRKHARKRRNAEAERKISYPGELCRLDVIPAVLRLSNGSREESDRSGHICLIIDDLTGMILSGSVSFDGSYNAAISNAFLCLRRSTHDSLLEKAGIAADCDKCWPGDILPGTLQFRRGTGLLSDEVRRKCGEAGILAKIVPSSGWTISNLLKEEFMGFIADEGLRRGTNLTICHSIEEATAVMLSCIIHHNTHVQEGGILSPADLWDGFSKTSPPHHFQKGIGEHAWTVMKPAKARMTRIGIMFRGLCYCCFGDPDFNIFVIGHNSPVDISVRYDEASMEHIFYVNGNDRLCVAELVSKEDRLAFSGMSYREFASLDEDEREKRRKIPNRSALVSSYVDIPAIEDEKRKELESIPDESNQDSNLDRPIREEDPDLFLEAFLRKYGYKK